MAHEGVGLFSDTRSMYVAQSNSVRILPQHIHLSVYHKMRVDTLYHVCISKLRGLPVVQIHFSRQREMRPLSTQKISLPKEHLTEDVRSSGAAGNLILVNVEDELCQLALALNPFTLCFRYAGEEAVHMYIKSVKDDKHGGNIRLMTLFGHSLGLYGLPERADHLRIASNFKKGYRIFNKDMFLFDNNGKETLYGTVPVLWSVSEKQTSGVFWNNAYDTRLHVNQRMSMIHTLQSIWHPSGCTNYECGWTSHMLPHEGAEMFLITGVTPKSALQTFNRMFPPTPIPPLFALGYHQCRWNYNSAEDLLAVSQNLRRHEMPCDALWLDIEYTDGKRYFTWDSALFPDVEGTVKHLREEGRDLVTIIDPHIKVDPDYVLYREGMEHGYFVRKPDALSSEDVFVAECWPKDSCWVDFLNPDASTWWSEHIANHCKMEGLHIWNDMNEPAVFASTDLTLPEHSLHYGGVTHNRLHNTYGQMNLMATWRGQLKAHPNLRPFLLSRSFFSARCHALNPPEEPLPTSASLPEEVPPQLACSPMVWTGDTCANWAYLNSSVRMMLTFSMGGIDLCGADVGGFFGEPENRTMIGSDRDLPPPEHLIVRWYQAAAYQVFYRGHAHCETKRREPYLLPPEMRKIVKRVLHERYALIPYWYTQFYVSRTEYLPVLRPLWLEFDVSDPQNRRYEERQFMVGPAIMPRPIVEPHLRDQVVVYLPNENVRNTGAACDKTLWYSQLDSLLGWQMWEGGQSIYIPQDISTLPVFFRGGHVVPRRLGAHSSTAFCDSLPYSLTAYLDCQNRAEGQLYEDDFHTFDYYTGDAFALYRFQVHFPSTPGSTGTITLERVGGNVDAWGKDLHVAQISVVGCAPQLQTSSRVLLSFQANESLGDIPLDFGFSNGVLEVRAIPSLKQAGFPWLIRFVP